MTSFAGKLFKIKTTEYDLIDHNSSRDLKLRIINIVSGSSILGIILRELSDSFLVGLPSKLLAYENNKRVVEPHMPVPIIRMFKPTILSMVPCFGEFEIFYIRYLLKEGKELGSEIVDGNFEIELRSRLSELTEEITKVIKEAQAEPPKQESDIDVTSAIMTPSTSKLKH